MADRSVRVFTVAGESRFVVVRNVPALGVIDDLLKRLSLYGKVCEYRLLDHPDDREAALQFEDASDEDSEFTDTVWVQYETVNNARHAKVRGVQKPFFGSKLKISYAPQYESRQDTAEKLAQRRQLLLRRARPNIHPHRRPTPAVMSGGNKRPASWTPPLPPPSGEFIGPQLPSSSQPKPPQVPPRQQHPQPRQAAPAVAKSQQNTKRRRI